MSADGAVESRFKKRKFNENMHEMYYITSPGNP